MNDRSQSHAATAADYESQLSLFREKLGWVREYL
jgi:hypothetical protein